MSPATTICERSEQHSAWSETDGKDWKEPVKFSVRFERYKVLFQEEGGGSDDFEEPDNLSLVPE